MQKKHRGLTRIIKAAGYSGAGLKAAFETEAAFRQELALLIVGAVIACAIHLTAVERVLMIGSLLMVLVVEVLNTAIETTIERISGELHPLSKKAKDLGSAAVLLALLAAALTWGLILFG